MNILHVTTMLSRQRLHIGLCVLLAAIFCVSGTDVRYDDPDDTDFKHLWDVLRLSHVKHPMKAELLDLPLLSQLSDIELDDDDDDEETVNEGQEKLTGISRLVNTSRGKRFGVAGLDNLDMMTKALDNHRQRRPLRLSVSNMNFNRMRQLMSQAGRRK